MSKTINRSILLTLTVGITFGLLAMPAAAAPNASNNTADVVEKPTYFKDVQPLLEQNCQVCHRPGGANLGGMVAPMSFTTYESTRPWAKSIARQVEARTMPPWHASPRHAGVFANERTLADAEIATLVNWVKSGAPRGDASDATAAKQWPETDGWSIGEPDLVIDMGKKYFVEDSVEDHYITFTTTITEDMLPEPRWVKAIEFRPGSAVVHHIIARPLGGIAPGNDPSIYQDGFATKLEPGTEIRWQMHYHKEPGEGTGTWDFSKAALRFYPKGYEPKHILVSDPAVKSDFSIPPGDSNYQASTTTTFKRDSLIMGYTPHMHLRGKSAKYVATYPDGTTEVLLDVPKYDFNWQTHYEYPNGGKKVPAGTVVEVIMAWDNSADNPSNPDPTQTVTFGQPTTSEMMFGFITYADAEPGHIPTGDGGFLGNRNSRTDRMKKVLKERFGLDWDTMTEDERAIAIKRLRAAREAASVGSP